MVFRDFNETALVNGFIFLLVVAALQSKPEVNDPAPRARPDIRDKARPCLRMI